MNWRHKLADWISGGELSRLTDDNRNFPGAIVAAYEASFKRRVALRAIAACETPKANATVKRMARMAREAME